jgi:Ni,Fe-hydrogenase III small subunit
MRPSRTASLFSLVSVFAFTLISVAQPQYYNLNTGTSTNQYPFNITGGKAVNSLFLAGEFSNPTPIPAGQAITTVYFRTGSAGTSTYTNLLILMAQDVITTLTSGAFYPGPYDTVYSHSSVTLTSTVGGWMGITLDHAFNYDPTKSLIIFVGQCGFTGSAILVYNSTSTGIRRTWSVGGCPFAPYASGDAQMVNFGVDVVPAPGQPQYYNLNTGTASNTFPFNTGGGKAVNWLFLAGEFNQPTPLPASQAITKVYFRTSTAGIRTYANLQILMAQDVITTLTSGAFYPGPYDTVYSHSSATLASTVDGWMTIPLDHAFNYDPTKSLIIFVGQCGSSGSTINVRYSLLSGTRRTWSVGGCPFAPYTSGDGATANFGVDVVPVPQYYNLNTGTASNTFPFNTGGGKAVNSLFLAGEFSNPTPLPAGQAITKVYFRTSTAGTSTYTNLQILMAQDVITTLTSGAFYPGPYDTVYSRPSTTLTSTVDGWMSIALDHAFNYDPTKSLILFVGQCGSTGSAINIFNSLLTGTRRTWSVGGCPFAPYSSGDARIVNFGVDVVPVGTQYDVPDVLYYTFENNSAGFTPNYAIPGVQTNPAPFTGSIGPGGQFDSALVGTNLASQGVATGWNMNMGARSWTIGMWLQIPNSASGNAYYLFGDPGAGSFRCFHNGAALPNNLLLRGSGIKDSVLTGIGPAPTYVHFVYDSATATIKAYKNGVLAYAAVQAAPLNFVAGSGFAVGGYTTSSGFGGLMDEFRFYSRALNETEIKLTWNHTLPYSIPTSVQPTPHGVPVAFELVQNYPNPFNPTTTIRYELPAAAEVSLTIYDILGREIKTLVDGQSSPGTFQVVWNGENASGNRVASGVYFYRLIATSSSNKATFTSIKKMILLK